MSCDAREIFELAEGSLGPRRKRQVEAHLDACPGCRERYEREIELNARLRSVELPVEQKSVCREVVMALPTRPLKARLLWAALALGLLAAASLALSVNGDTQPLVFVASMLDLFWSYVAGLAGAGRVLLVSAGYWILAALAVGAVVDLLIAALVVLARRRVREI